MTQINLQKNLTGSILDIGGGGEGVIGRIYGAQVIAIDNRQEELDEAPSGFEKRLMDASALAFADGVFDHATSFFTFMFMDSDTQRAAIREAARVLKPHGHLHIWDAEIESAYPVPFCIDLCVDAAGQSLHTTYGIGKLDVQSAESLRLFCLESGLVPLRQETMGDCFYLIFEKP